MDSDKQQKMLELFGEYRNEQGVDFETKRNTDNIDLFESMLRRAYPDTKTVVAGHHIMYTREGYDLPFEIASADTLIFDHKLLQILWPDSWIGVSTELASLPPLDRDRRLRELFSEI